MVWVTPAGADGTSARHRAGPQTKDPPKKKNSSSRRRSWGCGEPCEPPGRTGFSKSVWVTPRAPRASGVIQAPCGQARGRGRSRRPQLVHRGRHRRHLHSARCPRRWRTGRREPSGEAAEATSRPRANGPLEEKKKPQPSALVGMWGTLRAPRASGVFQVGVGNSASPPGERGFPSWCG